MRKLTLLITMLFLSLGITWAQTATLEVSTNVGYPEFQYKIKSANDVWMASHTGPTQNNAAKFAFFAADGENVYKIYSIDKQQWVSYENANINGNCRDFAKLVDSQDAANAWKITSNTRNNNAVYQVQPIKSDGSVSDGYWNYNGGVGNDGGHGYTYDDTKTVGLWTDNANKDGGSAWILTEEQPVSISEISDFVNGDVYIFVTTRGWMGAMSDNDKVISTAYTQNNIQAEEVKRNNANFQWAVYKSANDKYYLYNIGKKQFMGVEKNNNTAVPFADTPQGTRLTFKKSSNSDYPIMFSTNNNAVVNHSGSHAYGLISWTGGWETLNDGGSNHKVQKVGVLDETTKVSIEKIVAEYEATAILKMPEAGKYYRIKAVAEWNNDAPYLGSKNSTVNTSRAEFVAGADASTIFYLDEKNQLKNYATGEYLVNKSSQICYEAGATSGASFAFREASKDLAGAYNISFSNGGRWLYVNKNNHTDAGGSTNNDDGYCFNIEEVTMAAQIGEKAYYTLAEAVEAAGALNTAVEITLLADYTGEAIELPIGVTLVDSNGNSVTNDKITVKQPTCVYNFVYNGKTLATENRGTVTLGSVFPNITTAMPFGVSGATKPDGTVAYKDVTIDDNGNGVVTKDINVEINLPFEFAAEYDDIKSWYYVKNKGEFYLSHDEDLNYIALGDGQKTVDVSNKNAFSWAFVGNPFDGFQLVNKAAGSGKVLSSTTSISNDAQTWPVMTATPVPDGNNELWVLTASSHQTNGFFIAQKGHAANRMNNRGNKLAYWTGGADNGSTFVVTLRDDAAELQALVSEVKEFLNTQKEVSVGYITDAHKSAIQTAVDAAETAISSGNNSDIVGAELALRSDMVFDNTKTIQPETDKYYMIVSNHPGYANGGRIAVGTENGGLIWNTDTDVSKWFKFVDDGNDDNDKFYLYNVKSGKYLNVAGGHASGQLQANATDISKAKAVTITNMGKDNIVKIVPDGGAMIHAQRDYNHVVAWNNDSHEGASAWTIVEVKDPGVAYIDNQNYATLQDALNVWTEGKTINLIANTDETIVLPKGMTLSVINFNGFTAPNVKEAPSFEGEGTATSPYIIDNLEKLVALRDNVNSGEAYDGKYFKLTSNITLEGEWAPIGNGSRSSKTYTGNAFKGVFDGDNKTISGLNITSITGDAAVGLFGVVDGGTVKNLNLEVNINVANSDLAGAAIGMMLGGANAEGITVSGAVVGHDGVGGIVGRLIIDGTIANCTNNASVTSSYGGIGGIVGKAYYEDGSNTATFASITNCTNKGTITAPMYVGGIVGLARANVTRCVNEGAIAGGTQTGGIVGQLMAAGTVSANENKAAVSGKNHVGGIIGDYSQSNAYTYYNVSIANNINRGELSAQQCAAIMGCNNIDGFTAMTAAGNVSYYHVEGLVLFGNPEDMVIDVTNKFIVPVAQVGTETYYSFAEAVAAAQADDEIVMLANATVEGTQALPAGVKLTSNGHTINGSIRMLGNLELNGPLTITGGLWVGKKGEETLTATLSGDKLTANYFMFQYGTYTINADIDAVYGYLSYNGTFEVNSTIHTTGANGEVLYINGNVTLNNGAVLDSDNSVFVCNENAVLTLKPGSKVESNVNITVSGAKLNIVATDMAAGAFENITGTVTNPGNGTIAVVGNDKLEAKIENGKIVLVETAVATVNGVGYPTLQAAVDAATEDQPIVLVSDIALSETVTVAAGKVVTLDLNGKTVDVAWEDEEAGKHIYALTNNGTLTVTGNGTINTRGIFNYGVMTLTSGTINAIDGNGGYGVRNYAGATFTMNGGTIATTLEDDNKVDKGGYDASPVRVDEGATFTMNGGVINNICDFTVAIDNYGTTIINDGKATTVHTTLANSGTMTINGGEFTCNGIEGITAHALWAAAGETTINGGTFDGKDNYNGFNVDASEGAVVNITGGTFLAVHSGSLYGEGTIAVKGGTFFDNVSERCAAGYVVKQNDNGTFGIEYKPSVAKIGDQGYATLAEALAAASAMTGDVTVEILDKVTLNQPLTGSYSSIKFVGKAAAAARSAEPTAEIYLDVQGYIEAAGKKVAFEDLILSKSQGGYVANAGFMNLAFGVYGVTEATYTNCTFANGAYASTGNVIFTGCTFYRSHDRYGLWVYGDVNATVDGCTFADIRGIKMYDEGKAGVAALTVKNTDFTAADNKPAIVLTYGESVTLENNTYNTTQGVFELDLDGKPNGVAVTSDVLPTCVNDNGACGVLVDGKIYTTVAQAAEVATSGSTVTLLHESAETVVFPMGTTLNKGGFTADNVTVAAPVAKIGETGYATIAAAIDAAQAGDEIVVIADIADVTVDVTKNLTISGAATLNNVAINANGADALTVKGLTFTGNSWINSGTAEALTVSGVTATVAPSNTSYTNSRSAFISLGRSEQQTLALTVENCNITVTSSGPDAILGWAAITKATITGNVIKGSSNGYFANADAIKFMAIANGAEFEIKNNEIYSNYNGIVFGQNTTRDNAYSVSVDGNKFLGGADHIWIEISGGNTVHATVNATSANTVNGNAFTVGDIKYHSGVIKTWSSYAGVDVVTDENGKVIGGTLASFSNAQSLADGYEIGEGGAVVEKAAATINGVKYATLGEAVAALKDGETLVITSDITPAANAFIELNGKTNITLAAAEGVVINGNIQVGYHANHTDNNVDRSESTFTVDGLTVKGTLTVLSNDAKLVVKNSKAAQITVKTYREGMNIALNDNTADGSLGTATNSYGMYLVPNATGYNLAVDGNTFKNINSHAFAVQGYGDGNAVTAANSIAVTNNTFESWGTGGKADRAAFKIWADTKYAPAESDLNGTTNAMRELVIAIAAGNNTYSSTAGNTVQFDAYGAAGDAEDFPAPMYAVAKIGDTEFETLQEAVDAAAEGNVIVLVDDVEGTVMPTADSTNNPANSFVVVAAGKVLTLDLNGKTISVTGDPEAKYDAIGIRNHGNLTIVDNSEDKSGKLTYQFHGEKENGTSQIHSTILNFGTLTVNGGTLENNSTKGYAKYTINNYSWGGNANVTINGGHISNASTVAVYADGYSDFGTNSCNVTVTGGTVTGGLWYNGRTATEAKNIVISGGTFIEGTNAALTIKSGVNTAVVSGGTFQGAVSIAEGIKAISGGTFSAPVNEAYCAEGFVPAQNADGTYGVVVDPAYGKVAQIGDVYYETLLQAFAAAQNGEDVELIAATYEGIVIPAEFTGKLVINGDVVVENANGSAITGENINISGTGTLTAIANGDHAYGIGGDNTKSINIENVHILTVQGGHYGEIGSDTKYYKDAPEGGAAIGSGNNGAIINLTNVKIDEALGGSKAAGIGARYHTGVTINITGCTINKVEGGATAAGIGGSRVSSGATESEAVTINIQNSTITEAVGGVYAAGIGSGYDTYCQANQPICTINIDGSTINAQGGQYAAGIGTGYHNAGLAGEIKNSTITAASGDKVYKDSYTSAQDIGFGVADLGREGSNNDSSITYDGTKIALPRKVAKVGNTEYSSIDEAIANWTNGTTLTLLADVTLSDVIQLSSTEYHVLDLGTYTMTAASKKDAIQIVNNGRSSASYALDIKADANNPGGITATGKAVVRTTGKSGVKDRPIIRFYNGVFTGTNVIYHSGSNGTNCPQFQFHGGVFNGTVYANRALIQFYGGTFNGSLQMSVDSSAYALVAGGRFKQLSNLYGSALNSSKFTIGSAKGVYDREVYIDEEGYYVVAKTEPAEGIEADVAKMPGTNDYLAYSKVGTEGQLGYTNVETALKNNTSATVTVYVENVDMADTNFKGTIVVPENKSMTVTNVPVNATIKLSAGASVTADEGTKVVTTDGNIVVYDNGTFQSVPAVAKIGDNAYASIADALVAAQNANLTDVVITIVGENTAATADKFNLYQKSEFDNVTFKQENGNKPYYFEELYTGSRTNNGNFVFDGVNIVVTANGQYVLEGNVVLSNNSYIKSNAEANCFVYNAEVTVEAGSKIDGVIEDIRGGSLIIDGGKNDGTYCEEPALRDAILVVNWTTSNLVLRNGAYVKVNAANEVGRLTVNGKMDVSNSKLESYQYIAVNQGATFTLNAGSVITTNELTGAGVINVDATDFNGEAVTVIAGNLSGFTGTINVINNDYAGYAVTEAGLVIQEKTLAGEGTEANPYLINNIAELNIFRDKVNSGDTKYNAPGVWVALGADIDLAGITWTEGIGDGHNWSFDGNFDGKNHTIKNLTVAPVADANKYLCGGLFGYIYGGVTIKNLTIENATIEFVGEEGKEYFNVGVLVGFANNNGGKANISNITVKGDIKVNAPNAYGVGAIVGYSYRDMGTITSCTVEANDGSYIKGCSFVGGITGYSYTGATIADCSVKNIDITATKYSVAGIAGLAGANNTVSNSVVENVTVNGKANVGNVIGAIAANGIVVENCTAAEPLVGGNYSDNKAVEARIGNKYYATLDAALAAEGNEVTLLAPITVAADETRVLDLNGKTVSMVYAEDVTANHAMITNNGDLTIQSSVDGGKLSYTYTGKDLGTTYAANTITSEPGSVLTVKSGTIENLTFDSGVIAYAIDGRTNGNGGDVTVNIEGAVITSKRQAVRVFANSTSNTGTLNISGGEFTGRVIVQNASAKANKAALNITGGTFNANDYKSDVLYVGGSQSATIDINASVSGGTFNGEITDTHVTEFITGGTFGTVINEEFLAWGYQLTGNAAPYVVDYTARREALTIVDGEVTEFANAQEITVGTLTYERTGFPVNTWVSLYVPFEIPVSKLTELGYDVAYPNDIHFKGAEDDGVVDEIWAEYIKINAGVLKANFPYMIRANNQEATTMELVLEETTLYSTDSEQTVIECSSAFYKFNFAGTYKAVNRTDIGYEEDVTSCFAVANSGNWAEFTKDTHTLNPFRVYMTMTAKAGAPYIIPDEVMKSIGARVVGEENEDGTTVIYDVNAENGEDVIYDLNGRRVLETEKGGLYIINGKKVLVK